MPSITLSQVSRKKVTQEWDFLSSFLSLLFPSLPSSFLPFLTAVLSHSFVAGPPESLGVFFKAVQQVKIEFPDFMISTIVAPYHTAVSAWEQLILIIAKTLS